MRLFRHRAAWRRISVFAAIMTLAWALYGYAAPARAQGQAPLAFGHFFPETFQAVGGPFWQYWNARGGLAQQGYPISEEMQEVSDTDGKTYIVQYFERAVFEWHPEQKEAKNQVLLSLLGTFLYQQKYPNGAPGQVANTSPGSVLFKETGHRVGGKFLAYWQSHGALAQQGYPISEEFTEVSALNGQPYTVQYFERAVFEMHPENKAPYDVLLSQLGTFRYGAKYQSNLASKPGDLDGDGIPDANDICPKSPENINKIFDLDGCPDTLQTLVIFAAEDINTFWTDQFKQAGVRYTPPIQFVPYTTKFDTACGPTLPDNAFYCSSDHSIYYDYNFLWDQLQSDGDFAPVTILAHEWGHLVQGNLGLLKGQYYTVQTELQADCFAGAWAAHAGQENLLEEGDLEEGATALFQAGDAIDTPWFDPNAHGQPQERVDSFDSGLNGGVDACAIE